MSVTENHLASAEDQAGRQQIGSDCDLDKFSQPMTVNLGRKQRLTTGWFLFFLPLSADILKKIQKSVSYKKVMTILHFYSPLSKYVHPSLSETTTAKDYNFFYMM